jgi:hypothetical protein
MLREPDTVRYRCLLKFEVCTRFDFGQKTFDRNRSYDRGFDLYPLERLSSIQSLPSMPVNTLASLLGGS